MNYFNYETKTANIQFWQQVTAFVNSPFYTYSVYNFPICEAVRLAVNYRYLL